MSYLPDASKSQSVFANERGDFEATLPTKEENQNRPDKETGLKVVPTVLAQHVYKVEV